MKIKYEFANGTVEVEVSDEPGSIIVPLIGESTTSTTKRPDGIVPLTLSTWTVRFPSDENVEAAVVEKDEYSRLYAAIARLEPGNATLSSRFISRTARWRKSLARKVGITPRLRRL